MLTLNSFLQNLFKFVKSLVIPVSKRIYRTAAIISTGAVVIAIIALNSDGFGGGGRNALAALDNDTELIEEEQEAEETDDTEANIQVELTETWRQAQLLVGEQLATKIMYSMQVITAEKEELDTTVVMQGTISSVPVIPYTNEDYEIMLKIVEAEAGDCGEMGKILVANVVINRVKDERFPDTITEVVYQRNSNTAQFSPVSNGSINRVTVTQETIDSVDRALNGEDYSKGALFFMMRSASSSKNITWFDKELKWLFKDGPHEFFTYY